MSEVNPTCPSCGATTGRILMTAPDFDACGDSFGLYECAACAQVSTHPPPPAGVLEEAYRREYYGDAASKFVGAVERWTRYAAKRRARTLVAAHARDAGVDSPTLRILDIGCGRGVLLQGFKSLGHQVVGVERKGSPFEGLPDVVCGELDELGLATGSFDVIVLWHVLEHLEQPRHVLRHAARLLAPGGSLFISVPNFGSLQSRLFRASWFHLDLPRHLFHFTDRSLGWLFADAGFAVSRRKTFTLDQNFYGFLQSALNSVPGLPDNQLYRLLKQRPSPRSLAGLLAYAPLVLLLTVPAVLELLVSVATSRGATLTIRARAA